MVVHLSISVLPAIKIYGEASDKVGVPHSQSLSESDDLHISFLPEQPGLQASYLVAVTSTCGLECKRSCISVTPSK